MLLDWLTAACGCLWISSKVLNLCRCREKNWLIANVSFDGCARQISFVVHKINDKENDQKCSLIAAFIAVYYVLMICSWSKFVVLVE